LTALIQPGNSVPLYQIITGFFLALLISLFSLKLSFLTKSGTFAVFILAFPIFSLGGWQWTVPIFSFFILSSLLSKIREKKNPSVNDYFEKSGSRDFYQVLANGGPGVILVVINYFFPDLIWYYAYSGIIAASCADTWATEIGTMSPHNTYDILNFRKTEQGSSGGVSFAGFTGSLLGAFLISLISVLWIDNDRIDFILMITFAGFAAAVFDSLLGSAVQAQYKCPKCRLIVDKKIHCGGNAEKYRGINFMNNDFVNLASGLFGGIVVFSLTTL